MVDIVYILTNEAMPGLVKIGCTNGELASRIRQLYSTGVPLPSYQGKRLDDLRREIEEKSD